MLQTTTNKIQAHVDDLFIPDANIIKGLTSLMGQNNAYCINNTVPKMSNLDVIEGSYDHLGGAEGSYEHWLA